jgi:hypothetical protein
VNIEMLAILLFVQGMTTIRTYKSNWLEISLSFSKSVVTDFTQQLTATACIIVEVDMRSSTVRTDAIWRNRVLPTRVNRLEALAMIGLVFLQQKYVVQRLNLVDDG